MSRSCQLRSPGDRTLGEKGIDRFRIARDLQEIGEYLELGRTERFKASAYFRGARALQQYVGDLERLIERERLTDIPGIGPALSSQIKEIYATGRSSYLERLRKLYPPGALELATVPSLSLKKIRQLSEELGIQSIAELQAAAMAGAISKLKGFGARSEEKILNSIREIESRPAVMLLVDAVRVAQEVMDYISLFPKLDRIELAGAARRFQETVPGIDLVASSSSPRALREHFLRYPFILNIRENGRKACVVELADHTKVSLASVSREKFHTAWLYTTGSPAHVAKLEAVAQYKRLNLSSNGIQGRSAARATKPPLSEAAIYRKLGMQYIPPELREDDGEIEKALKGSLQDLIDQDEIRGMVHCHTIYSDGKNTVEEMAQAAQAMGFQYLTITDHSPTAFYAGGLKLDRLKAQWDEIDRVQERVSVRLMRGTESDILADGALDYPDEILERFDIIIASIHSRIKMNEDQMTRRVLGAVRQRHFKIWGHPLGRLLERRPPFDCRMEEILDAVAESRAAIEINGDPHRLDLEPRWIKEARKRSIKFVISTDAHSVRGLKNLRFGVGIARRGGVRRREVLNTLPFRAFQKAVRP